MQVCVGCDVLLWGSTISKDDDASSKCDNCREVRETLSLPATEGEKSLVEIRCSLCGLYLDDEVIDIHVCTTHVCTIPDYHRPRI